MNSQNLLSASSLSGSYVKNAKGEDLGHVKEIMIDVGNNCVAYYVLSFGGILGMGNKLFAIPPEALSRNATNDGFRLDVSQDLLTNTHGFEKDNWPNMADSSFRSALYSHYGVAQKNAA